MWWKIYFWFNILAVVVGLFAILGLATNTISLVILLTFAASIVAIIGLYSYIYKKPTFNKTFWFWFFWINVVYTVASLFYSLAPTDLILRNLSFLNSSATPNKLVVFLVSLLHIPWLYAVWQLSKSTNSKKK